MALCFLQLNAKKRFVYGSIAFIWIVFPSLEIVFSAVTTDIIDGTCIPFRVYPSYAAGKIIGFLNIFMDYLLPLPLLVFCYARIVHTLRTKVIFCQSHIIYRIIFSQSADGAYIRMYGDCPYCSALIRCCPVFTVKGHVDIRRTRRKHCPSPYQRKHILFVYF